jgi:hypothetical protein
MAHIQLRAYPRTKGYRRALYVIEVGGMRVLGDVMNPAPQEKCIVGITIKRRRNSDREEAIMSDASARNTR